MGDLQEQIYEKENLIDKLRTDGEGVYQQIIKDSTARLKSWYNENVEKYIKEHPDMINHHSDEEIKDLRRRISTLANSFEKLVTDSLDKSENFWHKGPLIDIDDAKDINEDIKTAFSQVFHAAQRSFRIGRDSFRFVSPGQPPSSSEDLTKSINRYSELYQQEVKPILIELKSLKEKEAIKDKEEAYKLAKAKWDKAGNK